MFCVGVREHVMIAHSFSGELFGPAQRLHGATYVVDVELRRPGLDTSGVVVDIGRATEVVRGVLGRLAFRNLDELPEFAGRNSTTEIVARWVAERVAHEARSGTLGVGSTELTGIKVTLHESHVAWASYELQLAQPDVD